MLRRQIRIQKKFLKKFFTPSLLYLLYMLRQHCRNFLAFATFETGTGYTFATISLYT